MESMRAHRGEGCNVGCGCSEWQPKRVQHTLTLSIHARIPACWCHNLADTLGEDGLLMLLQEGGGEHRPGVRVRRNGRAHQWASHSLSGHPCVWIAAPFPPCKRTVM